MSHIKYFLQLLPGFTGALICGVVIYKAALWLKKRKPWRRKPKAPRLFYVAAWGDDDKNPGTNELPFKTHARAFREERDGEGAVEAHLAEGLHQLETQPWTGSATAAVQAPAPAAPALTVVQDSEATVPARCTCWHGDIAHGDRGCLRFGCGCLYASAPE